jgi:gliding motility associated protien GldN
MNKFSLFSGVLLSVGTVLGQVPDSLAQLNTASADSTNSEVNAGPESDESNLFKVDDGYNKYSTKKIHESDIMWQKGVWRQVDLREKQNTPLMSTNRELPKVLLESVVEGVITPYTSDSLADGQVLTIAKFQEKVFDPDMVAAMQGFDPADTIGMEDPDEIAAMMPPTPEMLLPKQLYLIDIKEDMIFDKQRSVMYYDILAIGMKLPAELDAAGAERPIAWFSFKELEEKVFHTNPDAIWYNPANDAEHRNLSDAFELRLFSSYITKVSNPNDEFLVDIYGEGQTGIMSSEWKAYELLEFEHNLWEF